MRLPSTLGLVAALLAAPALAGARYAAEVWPYEVRRNDRGWEYRYDLTSVRSQALTEEALADVAPEELERFLEGLPREVAVSVRVAPAVVALSVDRELEPAPLSPSFALVSRGPFTEESAVGDGAAKARVPLHPEVPKVLPPLDLLLWKVRQLEDAVVAAAEHALEKGTLALPKGRAAFWDSVLDRALARHARAQGDAREGAAQLIARIAASTCLDPSRFAPRVKRSPDLLRLARAEVEALRAQVPPPRGLYASSATLRCVHAREWVLGQPLPNSRAGTAAALTFLALLAEDGGLRSAYQALAAFRDELRGPPAEDVLAKWQEWVAPDGADVALADLAGFYERLAAVRKPSAMGPPLFARVQSPSQRFLASLPEQAQSSAVEELAWAIQDGRLSSVAEEGAPWTILREAAWVPLLKPESESGLSGRVHASAGYRARLTTLFHALRSEHVESEVDGISDEEAEPGSGLLKVRLKVPPHLELEPLPEVFARAAASLERLSALVAAHPKLAKAPLVLEGRARGSVQSELQGVQLLLRGLEQMARLQLEPGGRVLPSQERAIERARRFLAAWRSDPDAARDVRGLEPRSAGPGELALAGVFGVGRRELSATFAVSAEVRVEHPEAGAQGPWAIDSRASQRYLVPVLVTGAAPAGAAAALDRAVFRALCDRAGRRREAIEAALHEAIPLGAPR